MNTVICEPAGGDFEFSTATVWFEFSLLKNLILKIYTHFLPLL